MKVTAKTLPRQLEEAKPLPKTIPPSHDMDIHSCYGERNTRSEIDK